VEQLRVTVETAMTCNRCGVSLASGRAFALAGSFRCLRCTLMRASLLRRSFLTALFVGSILTGINQGDVLLHGHFPHQLYWKLPLTYSVPFLVATWGALINTRT
jgi:hypothetical protein